VPADLLWRFEQPGTDRSQRRLTTSITRRERTLLVGLTGLYVAALLGALVLLANPDPERWGGWGPTGLTVAIGVTVVGLIAAIRAPRIGLWIGLLGSVIGMLAMPWAFYLFIPAPTALAYWVRRRSDAVAPRVAGI
jgi:hypothetical protein